MAFEWDDAKSNAYAADRGFDFNYASQAFLDPQQIATQDLRWNYGEERFRVLADIEGRTYVVIFTKRDSLIRIISARKANAREVVEYVHRTQDD